MTFTNKNGQPLNFEAVQITSDRQILRPITLMSTLDLVVYKIPPQESP